MESFGANCESTLSQTTAPTESGLKLAKFYNDINILSTERQTRKKNEIC